MRPLLGADAQQAPQSVQVVGELVDDAGLSFLSLRATLQQDEAENMAVHRTAGGGPPQLNRRGLGQAELLGQ